MHKPKNRAVFFDRDGVLNEPFVKEGKPYPPSSLEEFKIVPDAREALSRLLKAGYLLIVITNQPDVLRGTQKKEVVEAMHQLLKNELPIDDLSVCYDEHSSRYKPHPQMIYEAAGKHKIDLQASFMVGDRWRDIDAGSAAGCKTILIDRKYQENLRTQPDWICQNLTEAATIVLNDAEQVESKNLC